MLKKINENEVKFLYENISLKGYKGFKNLNVYSKEAFLKANEKALNIKDKQEFNKVFVDEYNKTIEYRNANPKIYTACVFKPDAGELFNFRNSVSLRNKRSQEIGANMDENEVLKGIKNDFIVYVCKYKNHRVEKEINSIKELEELKGGFKNVK